MSQDYITLGPTPAEETCLQAPYQNQHAAIEECRRFASAIYATVGLPPEGAYLKPKFFPYDGSNGVFDYCELVCYYDADNELATRYAFACESNGPSNWPEGYETPEAYAATMQKIAETTPDPRPVFQ